LIKINRDRLWRIDVHETSDGKRKGPALSADEGGYEAPHSQGFGDYGHLEGAREDKAGWSAAPQAP
jgi:hypothetical protein